MSVNDVPAVRDPSWPERVEIYDTTLRDGSQLEGISLTVDDKLRIAEQLDWLGVDFIEAGWPGANPKDDEFFARAPTRAVARHVHAGRVRVDPPGQGQGRLRRHAAQPARREHVDGVHRRQVVGLPRARSAQHHARRGRGDGRRLGRVPARRRARRDRTTPSTSSTATSATPSSACACSRRRCRRARAGSCSATRTAARCPTRSSASSRDGRRLLRQRRRRRRPPPRRRRHRCRQRTRRRARRRGAGAGHDQRLRRAHRQLQPHHDHPEPHAEDGDRDHPARPPRAAHAGRAPRGRAGQHGAQPAGGRTSARSAFAHKAGLHVERDRQAPRRLRARPARLGRQRHPLRGVGARGQEHADAQGQGARPRARRSAAQRPRRHAEADGARRLPLRGRRRVARAADAPSHRLGAALVRGRSRSGSSPTTTIPSRPRSRAPASPPRPPSRSTSTGSA